MSLQGVLTLDVEDWDHANYSQLNSQRSRIERELKSRRYAMEANTDRWIELLGAHQARSTCFVLGEFAERYPQAVKKLANAGHEIASHGATHDLIYNMNQDEFREYLKRGLGVLGDLIGKRPVGFRAPSWSVSRERTPWFCEELEAQGLRYDSSEFPIKTPLFGQKGAKLSPYRVGKILRIPVTVLSFGGMRIPFASGAFFRLSPLSLIRYGLRRAAGQKLPVMIVLHPRELDPDHPRLPLQGWESRVHYARLSSTVPKLKALLEEMKWSSIQDAYSQELDTPDARLDN